MQIAADHGAACNPRATAQRDVLLRTGTRAVLAIPMLREDQLIGGLTINKKTPGSFAPEVIELLQTFATQSALAIQNARLFRELADKSRQRFWPMSVGTARPCAFHRRLDPRRVSRPRTAHQSSAYRPRADRHSWALTGRCS